ncbi:hypothetical protein FNV43_RR19802 [Rhamnella rubrinervis]|uniref:BHLH domain-containing protein n=1 Tax=Rhamnella rubrinervis TaxID=2594499 RepID=A0A8K0GSS1_9ROSA|nr:hypothetical protein FNV43_RR19802 [Rhamnella rubrinervis]
MVKKMMKQSCSSSESMKLDRKTVERNRRIHMKSLCFKLASLIPSQYFKPSKDMLSQQDQLDIAASYIKQLSGKIDKLKVEKEEAVKAKEGSNVNIMIGSRLPVIELKDMGSSIEVILISGLNKNFMLSEVVSVLEEEGAEVVSASFSTVGGKVFHSLHAQVKISRVGVETTRVWQRLQDLIY